MLWRPKSSLTWGCIHWHASLQMANQVQAGTKLPGKAPFRSKVYRITGWKHGNVQTESKHLVKLAYFTTHLWKKIFEIYWNLSLAIFGHSFSRNFHPSPMNSGKKHSLIWNLFGHFGGDNLASKKLTPKNEFTPNLQAGLATHEMSSILNPCAVDVVGHPRVKNWWSGWVFERCLAPTRKNTLIDWNTQGNFI